MIADKHGGYTKTLHLICISKLFFQTAKLSSCSQRKAESKNVLKKKGFKAQT